MSKPSSSAGALRAAPAVAIAVIGAVLLAAAGLMLSRPDVAAVGLPLAVWATLAVAAPSRERGIELSADADSGADSAALVDTLEVWSDAEAVELALVLSDGRMRRMLLPARARVVVKTKTQHSGPLPTLAVAARAVEADGALIGPPIEGPELIRSVPPTAGMLSELPLNWQLTGLHGGHDGDRQGQGGDFRDIHPFVPGDELRRVDWRATARAARRPGDLLVRRTDALSDASVVIAMDTADDLGTVVATWGRNDPARTGVTSLDHARAAARTIAEAATASGDRVSCHTLAQNGRSVRSGAGPRHLSRLVSAIAASGEGGDDARFRRTPPIPHGAIVWVLSTFFDGAATEIALTWRAAGHRVVAVDVLPALDETRLIPERQLALRVLLAERADMLEELRAAGIDTIAWHDDPATAVAVLVRAGRRRSGGRMP